MLADKSLRTKVSICSINDSVARKIARREFKESFSNLVYSKEHDRFVISIKVRIQEMSEKEKKKLKEQIAEFEQEKEWINVFKVEILNKIEL